MLHSSVVLMVFAAAGVINNHSELNRPLQEGWTEAGKRKCPLVIAVNCGLPSNFDTEKCVVVWLDSINGKDAPGIHVMADTTSSHVFTEKLAPDADTTTIRRAMRLEQTAMEAVNERRARRGLRPFIEDPELTKAAQTAAEYRAERRMAGHTDNDFKFSGGRCTAAGCAAWPPSMGWGSCCAEENWTYAGAGWAMGSDGLRYMHLMVR